VSTAERDKAHRRPDAGVRGQRGLKRANCCVRKYAQAIGLDTGAQSSGRLALVMGDIQRAHALAADLVDSTPDPPVAVSTPSLTTIQKATHKIPIVFVAVSEPVFNGFVPSLARPGGNATGFSNLEPSIGGRKVAGAAQGHRATHIARVSEVAETRQAPSVLQAWANLTHNGPRFTTHLFADSAIGNVDTPLKRPGRSHPDKRVAGR
jgi:ABC transporter substrate binding protein